MNTARSPFDVSFSAVERRKVWLLSAWFFVTTAALWLLKPIRTASLLAHLGAAETPYVRLAAAASVAVVVAVYSRLLGRLSRLDIARGAGAVFVTLLLSFWSLLTIGGESLGRQRPIVWAVYILVEVYASVMIGVFWTYTNDVVSSGEADKLYGPIGMGGIAGGIAGGALVDVAVKPLGPVNMLLICAALVAAGTAIATAAERVLRPEPRRLDERAGKGLGAAFRGAREVYRSRYLLLLVGIVVGYEFSATLADFAINVVFERSFRGQTLLAQMYGRLGWMAGVAGIGAQLFVVPRLLPSKRLALIVPPLAMAVAAVGLAVLPVVGMAMLLGVSDRGLNCSLHQSTKETLYVSLGRGQKYRAKAFIDMFVDRAAKAAAALALVAVVARQGISIHVSIRLTIVAVAFWCVAAFLLGKAYARRRTRGSDGRGPASDPPDAPSGPLHPHSHPAL